MIFFKCIFFTCFDCWLERYRKAIISRRTIDLKYNHLKYKLLLNHVLIILSITIIFIFIMLVTEDCESDEYRHFSNSLSKIATRSLNKPK